MFVLATQVRCSFFISVKFDCCQLGDCYSQCPLYSSQSGLLCLVWRACKLLEEIAAIRVIMFPDGPVRFAHQLGHYMQVANRAKEFRNITKITIDVYLFQVCLCAPFRVSLVLWVRTSQDLHVILRDALFLYKRAPQFVLCKTQLIARCVIVLFFAKEFDANDDIWVLSRS